MVVVDASAIAERLKDVADELDLFALRGTISRGPDRWTNIEVRHAGIWDDAPDGWAVDVEDGAL